MTTTQKLFQIGLAAEHEMVQHMEQGRVACVRLLKAIRASEDEYVAARYSESLHLAANALWVRAQKAHQPPPETIQGFRDTARRLMAEPSRIRKVVPPGEREHLRRCRLKLIKLAIENNVPLPETVLQEYSSEVFHELVGGYMRSYKARLTAYCDRTGKEDHLLYTRYGVLIRMQDGTAVKQAVLDQIRAAMDELFFAVGNFSDILRHHGVTIIHTGGKHIFLESNQALGAYHLAYRTVTVGVREGDKPSVRTLAHELLGHWLDRHAVPRKPVLNQLYDGKDRPHRSVVSVSYLDARFNRQSCLQEALYRMTPIAVKNRELLADLVSPNEIYARLMEQYLSLLLFQKGIKEPVSVHNIDYYMDQRGFWDKEVWDAGFNKEVHKQLLARWELAELDRQQGTWLGKGNLCYPFVFPWTNGTRPEETV